MPKHCPSCGKSSADTKFYGEFCEACTEKKVLEKLPSAVELTVCKRCGMVRSMGKFLKQDKEAIEAALAQQLKGYSVTFKGADEETIDLAITDVKPDYSITIEKKIHVNWKKSMCERCNRIAGSYYEAMLQLRGSDTDKIERFIKRVTRYFEHRNEFVTMIKKADNGLDVYLSNKKLASAYLSSHGVKAVASYTLYGVKQGKKVYRHTYAIRL